ncbi:MULTISPECIES: hypothetical protein [Chelativorans]|nr:MULTISPECIES: hypothetical protein [Chelativorans]
MDAVVDDDHVDAAPGVEAKFGVSSHHGYALAGCRMLGACG